MTVAADRGELAGPASVSRDLSGLRQLVHRRGSADGDAIALTFDDGPVARTEQAVEILDAHGVPATFFFVGEKVRGREPLLERMRAAGHEIANHSFHHLFYPSVDDIAAASEQQRRLTGVAPRLYRPPFGAIDRPTALAVRDAGMTPVTWDVDSEDVFPVWEGLAPEGVHRNVVDRVRGGSIVLLHDGSVWSRAVEALPRLIETLEERGYRLVTVSQLLAEAEARSGGDGEPGGTRRSVMRESTTALRPSRRAGRLGALRVRRLARGGDESPRAPDAPSETLRPADFEHLKPREVVTLIERRARPGGKDAASGEQLGRALAARVALNPVAFSRLADDVLALDPAYLQWFLAGLAAAVGRTRDLAWPGVLSLVEGALATPPGDPARREAGLLFDHALAAGTIPGEFGDRAWRSIDRLSWSGREEADEPSDAAADDARVQAMCAVVRYAEWAAGGRGLASLPEVRDNLDAHLDPAREPSAGVRGVYGSQLRRLLTVDRRWLAGRIGAILPREPNQAPLRRAAWAGHLLWGLPGGDLLEMLGSDYRREVEALPAPAELRRGDHGDPGRIVARHLGELFLAGALELEEDGLLATFLARGAADELAYLVKLLGLRSESGVQADVPARLAFFWNGFERAAAARSDEEACEILAPFGTWYAAGALDAGWLDARLGELLAREMLVEPVFRVAERLASRAAEDPAAAAGLALAQMRLATEWDLRAVGPSLGAVARAAREAPERETRELGDHLARGLEKANVGERPRHEPQSAPAP